MNNAHKKILTLTLIASCVCTPLLADMHQDKKVAERKAKTFLEFDTDGDKMLNKEEYASMIQSWFENKGKEGYEKAAKRRFKNKDTDEDGLVSFKEQFDLELPE